MRVNDNNIYYYLCRHDPGQQARVRGWWRGAGRGGHGARAGGAAAAQQVQHDIKHPQEGRRWVDNITHYDNTLPPDLNSAVKMTINAEVV